MNELAATERPPTEIGYSLPPVDFIIDRAKRVDFCKKELLKPDIHFGVIPGTKKPVLYKAGAEKLCLAFGLAFRFQNTVTELAGGHISVESRCQLIAMGSGFLVGEYTAVCCSLEDKYRYRNSQGEPTGKPVPPGYWEARENKDKSAMEKALGGKSFFVKKNAENKWEIFRRDGQMVENDSPGALRHTMLAMAQKRSFVGVTRIGTATSDDWDQETDEDLIDNPTWEDGVKNIADAKHAAKPTQTAKPAETPRSGPARPAKAAFDPSKMLAAYQAMGVHPHMLVAKVGRTVPDWTDADQQFARDLYKRLKDGETTVAAEWPPVDPAIAEVCAEIRESAKKLIAADLAPRVQSAFKGAGCECSDPDMEKQPKTKLDILAQMLSDAVEQIPPPTTPVEDAPWN